VIAGGGGYTFSDSNSITQFCPYSFIGGGHGNLISGSESAIGGGYANHVNSHGFVGGGYFNHAEGNYAVVLGGANCQATGDFSTIVGGGRRSWAVQHSKRKFVVHWRRVGKHCR